MAILFSKLSLTIEYCSARKKEIVFVQQKQSVPISINQFVEMAVFLCLICFSIYDKMQGFLDESGLFIFYLFIYFFAFYAEIQNGHEKWRENDFWKKSPVDYSSKISSKLLYLAPFPR